MSEKYYCPICGHEIRGITFDDALSECDYCGWGYIGFEDELEPDEIEGFNSMTIRHAREMFKKGRTVNGDPLPHKKS